MGEPMLIERLKHMEKGHNDNGMRYEAAVCHRAASRIAELEALEEHMDEVATANYELWQKAEKRIAELEAEVKRLREGERRPGYHHPDCNYWKWDWRFSWHETDCTCDDVCGPSKLQEKGDA